MVFARLSKFVIFAAIKTILNQLRKYSTKSGERIRNAKCYPIDVSLMNARKVEFYNSYIELTLIK